jgi:hypothetical protein
MLRLGGAIEVIETPVPRDAEEAAEWYGKGSALYQAVVARMLQPLADRETYLRQCAERLGRGR